ncbi:MAG: N-acetyltransferase [Proteobacteria bacterium]|nr:N-acetyltransferase [Pseudomonadota bacterium]
MNVRDATEDDLPAILAIINEATANTTAVWSLAQTTLEARRTWWQDRVAAGYPVLVAEDHDGVLGFASYAQFRPWDGYLHTVEHSVYVDQRARWRGVGRALLAALIERATERGMHVMVAGIEATNLASIRLHETLGFTRAGTLVEVGRKFDRWLDLLFMQLILPDQDAAPEDSAKDHT